MQNPVPKRHGAKLPARAIFAIAFLLLLQGSFAAEKTYPVVTTSCASPATSFYGVGGWCYADRPGQGYEIKSVRQNLCTSYDTASAYLDNTKACVKPNPSLSCNGWVTFSCSGACGSCTGSVDWKCNAESCAVTAQEDARVPNSPTALNYIVYCSEPQKIRLMWAASYGGTAPPITGYRVYRGTKLEVFPNLALRATVAGASNTVYDDSAADGDYAYYVTASNDNGESGPSNRILVGKDCTPHPPMPLPEPQVPPQPANSCGDAIAGSEQCGERGLTCTNAGDACQNCQCVQNPATSKFSTVSSSCDGVRFTYKPPEMCYLRKPLIDDPGRVNLFPRWESSVKVPFYITAYAASSASAPESEWRKFNYRGYPNSSTSYTDGETWTDSQAIYNPVYYYKVVLSEPQYQDPVPDDAMTRIYNIPVRYENFHVCTETAPLKYPDIDTIAVSLPESCPLSAPYDASATADCFGNATIGWSLPLDRYTTTYGFDPIKIDILRADSEGSPYISITPNGIIIGSQENTITPFAIVGGSLYTNDSRLRLLTITTQRGKTIGGVYTVSPSHVELTFKDTIANFKLSTPYLYKIVVKSRFPGIPGTPLKEVSSQPFPVSMLPSGKTEFTWNQIIGVTQPAEMANCKDYTEYKYTGYLTYLANMQKCYFYSISKSESEAGSYSSFNAKPELTRVDPLQTYRPQSGSYSWWHTLLPNTKITMGEEFVEPGKDYFYKVELRENILNVTMGGAGIPESSRVIDTQGPFKVTSAGMCGPPPAVTRNDQPTPAEPPPPTTIIPVTTTVNGECGSANKTHATGTLLLPKTFTVAELCLHGSPDPASVSLNSPGTVQWTCAGSDSSGSADDATCSATLPAPPVTQNNAGGGNLVGIEQSPKIPGSGYFQPGDNVNDYITLTRYDAKVQYAKVRVYVPREDGFALISSEELKGMSAVMADGNLSYTVQLSLDRFRPGNYVLIAKIEEVYDQYMNTMADPALYDNIASDYMTVAEKTFTVPEIPGFAPALIAIAAMLVIAAGKRHGRH